MTDTAGRGLPVPVRSFRSFSPLDGMLLLLALIWGANFSVMKMAIAEIPPLGFNLLRLLIASVLLLGSLASASRPRLTRSEWRRLLLLGCVGHFLYQICLIGGLARTSVANSALILGCIPVAIMMLSAAISRHETVTRLHWLGGLLSVVGIYLAVGRGASLSGGSRVGDLLTMAAVWCWAVYTIGARPLLARHSPIVVTSYTLAIGAVLYAPVGARDLVTLEWARVGVTAWMALVFSAALSLSVGYVLWYTAVQRLGSTRTASYQNLVPVWAMIIAAVWLREPLDGMKIAGVATILLGVALTRVGRPQPVTPPLEE